MSDGQSAQTGNCDIKAQLPTNIKTIDVAFTKDECLVHSISFKGDSILTIGGADSANTRDDWRKGRTDLDKLYDYAKICRVEKVLQPIIETIVSQ